MLLSIIIPVFNGSKYIVQCLESIISQQSKDLILGKDYEIIVVDDGSTDDTKELVNNFCVEKSVKIEYVLHESNLGAGKAVNSGLDKAHGEYISWMGADDVMAEDSIKDRLEALQVGDCDVVYTDFEQIDKDNNKIGDVNIRPAPTNSSAIRQLMVSNYINGSTVMMKKTNLRYDETLKADPDCDMWLRLLALNCRFKHIRSKTIKYRIHEGQVSQDVNLMAKSKDTVRVKYISEFPERIVMGDVLSSWREAYVELANMLFNQGLFGSAIAAMNKSINADNAKPIIPPRVIQDKPRLAVISGGGNAFLSFIPKLIDDFDIKTNRVNTASEINALCQWADIAWFEWVDAMLLTATKIDKHCKYITRLHSYEAFDNIIQAINWAKVDDIVFVAKHIQDIGNNQSYEMSKVNQHIIPNGIDFTKRTYKAHGHGFNLAYVGYLNHKKNPSLLLQCMSALKCINPQYKLHVAGIHQELRYQLYWNKMLKELDLIDNVIMYGWIEPENINEWLQDKDYVISTSELESFCYGIADGMACGIKPLCHNWVGAENIYPSWALFNTIDDVVKIVGEKSTYLPQVNRTYVEERYDLNDVSDQIKKLLLSRV